ncbi:MAG: response regulator [Ignavibacteriales bacterium]|nr:response regulator [Ignavibacteriales bacterium]
MSKQSSLANISVFIEALNAFSKNITTPFAFADSQKKIIFYNLAFKILFNGKRIKGKKVGSLFTIDELTLDSQKPKNKSIATKDISGENDFLISPFFSHENKIGYSISGSSHSIVPNDSNKNTAQNKIFLFQKEWENIISLLIKEKSLDDLTIEILMRCVNLSESSFGITIINDDNARHQMEFKLYDDDKCVKNSAGLLLELTSNFSYLTEWFKINKKSMVVSRGENNIIGYSIFRETNVESIVILPCFIEKKILAVLIFAKAKTNYSTFEINYLEQLAALFAFAINSTVTQKLNTALESKLIQSQKLETIGKLASGIAHDFNNLLSSIFGSVNLLKKKLTNHEELFYLLENIENCSVRATDLTKGLLNYGKPTSRRKTLIKPTDILKELLRSVNQTFPRNISIEKKISPNLFEIMGNSTEIYQVLLNLCINAKEAIIGTGTITLEANNFSVDKKNQFEFPLLEKRNYVCISVADTGEGINEENLSKIFDPYFSTKKKDTGSGLGLYVTYGIVKAHNGHIDVSSSLNKGTRFNIFLPAFEMLRKEEKVKTEKIILLADDEIMLRDLLAELLESYDYQVICVQNGAEVLKVLTEEIKVDLLIIDYNMPEMDGITCINKIKTLDLKVPIILSTGSSSAKVDLEIEKLEVDSILTKPYEFEQMLEIVQKLI